MAIKKMDAKEFWRLFGIFSGIIIVLFGLNFGFIKLTENKWERDLKKTVQNFLDEKYPDEWLVSDFISLENPFYMSAAAFNITSKKINKKAVAVIIRTQTFYGPYPAVYIYEDEENSYFAGYSNIHGRIKNLMEKQSSDIFISHWQKKLPDILGNHKNGGKK